MSEDLVDPLALEVTQRADNDLETLTVWLDTVFEGGGKRLVTAFYVVTTALCQSFAEQIAVSNRPATQPVEGASLAFSQPVFEHRFTTQKRRQRHSSSGTYRLYFALVDRDEDGQIDTLRVLTLRHAAARPIWENPEEETAKNVAKVYMDEEDA